MTAPHEFLTIDCGNSTISCRLPDGVLWATSSSDPDFTDLALFAAKPGLRVVVVSVVPEALAAVRAALPKADFAVVDIDLKCPLSLAYDGIATLGADRWLGAFAAYRRFGAAITIDCGTATTINVVDSDGVFHGGAIAPGLAALVAGLQVKAKALPPANLDASPVMPAKSTQDCVDAGVLLGWAGLVERLVGNARKHDRDAQLVVTGGNAERLLRLSELASERGGCERVPELLHDGLAELAAMPRS